MLIEGVTQIYNVLIFERMVEFCLDLRQFNTYLFYVS